MPQIVTGEHRLADATWMRASHFAQLVSTEPCGGSYTAMRMLQKPLDALAYVRVARALPTLRLPSTSKTRELHDIITSTSSLHLLGREPVAVLDIPADSATYLRGRKRQALRTNRSKAIELQCNARVIGLGDDRVEINRLLSHILGQTGQAHTKDDAWPVGLTADHIGVVGYDGDGRAIVLAVARRFGAQAVLETFLRFYVEDIASVCRSLVHVQLVEELSRRGVRHLIVGGALRLDEGLQYLQVLQGYRPMNLTFEETNAFS